MPHIELGTKLILKPLTRAASESEIELVSRLEAEMPDNHIVIEAPIHKGTLYPISIKQPLHVSFTYKDGIYNFRCVAVERFTKEGLHYISARIVSDISRNQRRSDFRVKEAIPGEFTVWKSNDGETQEVHSECLSCDISCGGIALYTKEACEVGESIIVSIPIGLSGEVVHIYSEVRRCTSVKVDSYNFLLGVRFRYSDNSEKETVGKYVNQLQQKMIQKMRSKK